LNVWLGRGFVVNTWSERCGAARLRRQSVVSEREQENSTAEMVNKAKREKG